MIYVFYSSTQPYYIIYKISPADNHRTLYHAVINPQQSSMAQLVFRTSSINSNYATHLRASYIQYTHLDTPMLLSDFRPFHYKIVIYYSTGCF